MLGGWILGSCYILHIEVIHLFKPINGFFFSFLPFLCLFSDYAKTRIATKRTISCPLYMKTCFCAILQKIPYVCVVVEGADRSIQITRLHLKTHCHQEENHVENHLQVVQLAARYVLRHVVLPF